jgi:hypothetical protein
MVPSVGLGLGFSLLLRQLVLWRLVWRILRWQLVSRPLASQQPQLHLYGRQRFGKFQPTLFRPQCIYFQNFKRSVALFIDSVAFFVNRIAFFVNRIALFVNRITLFVNRKVECYTYR